MIDLITYPPISMYGAIPKEPIPVSDCLAWELQPDDEDLVETAGSAAYVKITFPLTFTPPAMNTPFKIWKRDFIFSGDFDYTAMSFDSDGEANPARNNFANMIEANIYFSPFVNVNRSGDDNEIVQVTWKSCEELADFDGDNTDLTAFTAFGATVEVFNGSSVIYVPGYKITLGLMKYIGTQFSGSFKELLSRPQGIEPKRTCTGALLTYVNVMQLAKATLFTPLPVDPNDDYALNDTYEEEPLNQNMMGRFVLGYGWVYRDANCQVMTGTYRKSDEVLVINSAFEESDRYKMRPYWFGHPDGFPPGQSVQKFLTNQPDTHIVGEDTKCWLWMTFNFKDTYPTVDKIVLNIVIYQTGSSTIFEIVELEYNACEWWQVKQFNVSPGRIFAESTLLDISQLGSYEVKADIYDGAEILANGTEYKKYVISRACQNSTDITFTTPIGGMSPLLVEIMEREVNQEGTEICVSTPCVPTGYGGRSLNEIRNFERITVRATRNYSPEEVEFFKGFKTSPERWIRQPYGEGWCARKFIVETGGIQIYRSGEFVDLVATGYLSDIQSPQAR